MKNDTQAIGRVAPGKDTESRILEAASQMFALRGFRASTMRDIAYAARINEVTIYRYFPGKQDLCWRAVDWKLRNANVSQVLIHPLTKTGVPKNQLEHFLVTALRLLEGEPKLARLLYFASLELD
ncbi:MAG: TetR/AcrR family transcriptional regulator, partial [Acidobacteriaceae bacterium]